MGAMSKVKFKIQIHVHNFMAHFSDELLFFIKYKSIV